MKTASTIHHRTFKNRTRARARVKGCRARRACVETTAKRTGKPTRNYDDRGRLESCSRDPIGFLGGDVSLYRFTDGNPLRYLDPTGLWKIVGVEPNGGTPIHQTEGGEGFGGSGDCYAGVFPVVTQIPCPRIPKDSGKTPYSSGLEGFWGSLEALKKRCKDGKDSCCSDADCEQEALRVVVGLMLVWQENYGRGYPPFPDDQGHPVGGYLCHHWARLYYEQLSTMNLKCFVGELKMAPKTETLTEEPFIGPNGEPGVKRTAGIFHWWLHMQTCGGPFDVDNGWHGNPIHINNPLPRPGFKIEPIEPWLGTPESPNLSPLLPHSTPLPVPLY